MKCVLQKLVLASIVLVSYLFTQNVYAQATCGVGYKKATINHDAQYFSTLPTSTINYMFGRNNMRFSWSKTGTNTNTFSAITGSHTGSGSSFGTGNDMKFDVNTGTDTLVFDNEVTNLKLSVYDVDIRSILTVTAKNAAGTSLNVTMAKVSGTNLTIAGTATAPTATASSTTNIANTSTDGTVNITVAGPVKTVILAFTKYSGSVVDSVFISDISACNNNSNTSPWATNYQSINTPDPGMPSFVLAAYKDSIMMVDMTNRAASLLFRDVALSASGINSLAIDPENKIVYYTDNVRASTNKSVYKYDLKTMTKSTFISDVTTLGITLYSSGLGSGGASFYDGSLFLGQDVGSTAGEPVTIYKIDIDSATGVATKASRFWSQMGNSVTATFFDWSDFVINDGILYNFNFGKNAAAGTRIMHISLDSMVSIYGTTDTFPKSQVSIDYAGNIYNMSNGGSELYSPGTGTLAPLVSYSGTGSSVIIDAGESFKPTFDYGDAPSSYGKAAHLFSPGTNLLIGSAIDYQPKDTTNSSANADDLYNTGSADDEDGVASFPTLTVANASYSVTVAVTNSTGANATLYGFLDFNADGDFADAGERSSATTVANGATSVTVTWTALSGGTVGSSFVRFRLATTSTDAQNYSGYSATGEAEDYPISINGSSLPVELVSFKGELIKEKKVTILTWSTASELNNNYFDIQRKSQNSTKWVTIGKVSGHGNSNKLISYNFTDDHPAEGENYYRLNQVDFSGRAEYSPTVMVKLESESDESEEKFSVYPNPVTDELWIHSEKGKAGNKTTLEVFNILGETAYADILNENPQRIDLSVYQKGIYFIKIGKKTYRVIKE